MAATPQYVIVWDLDNTVGDFTTLHERGECHTAIKIRVRPGLAEALTILSREGFTHTLLTLATPLYAEMVLRVAGLRPFFARVEGFGQRGKGDAAGIGDALGIPADQRPHRMIFVGDHPIFDEPRDPRVVFHLEPCAMTRPASDLTRMIQRLRESGQGSLRNGFDRWMTDGVWWKRWRWLREMFPSMDPSLVSPADVGDLLLMERKRSCPVIGFADVPKVPGEATEYTFIPAELAPQVRSDITTCR